MKFNKDNKDFLIIAFYARHNSLDRLELWEELEYMAEQNHSPWMVGGDFNIIIAEKEKLGVLSFTQMKKLIFPYELIVVH